MKPFLVVLLPFVYSIALAAPCSAQQPASAPAPHRYIMPRPTACIVGRVVYSDGRPASNMTVVAAAPLISSPSMQYLFAHATAVHDEARHTTYMWIHGGAPREIERMDRQGAVTDQDGRYRIENVTSAPYDLVVTSASWPRRKEVDPSTDWVAPAQTVTAHEEQTVTAPDLVLDRGTLLQGRVLDQQTGRPLPGMLIRCSGPQRPSDSGMAATAMTDSAGRFSVRVVPGANQFTVEGVQVDWLGAAELYPQAAKLDAAVWDLADRFTVEYGGKTYVSPQDGQPTSIPVAAGADIPVTLRVQRKDRQTTFAQASRR